MLDSSDEADTTLTANPDRYLKGLRNNIPHEHRRNNPLQNTSRANLGIPNLVIYKGGYLGSSLIYLMNKAGLTLRKKSINVIHNIDRIKWKKLSFQEVQEKKFNETPNLLLK